MIQLLQTGILNESLIQIEWGDYTESVVAIHRHLEGTNNEMTGWLNSPLEDNEEIVRLIQHTAYEIKMLADVLVVIGVGGHI